MGDSYFESMQKDKNNLSFWFPKLNIETTRTILKKPNTWFHEVPEEIYHHMYLEGEGLTLEQHQEAIYQWVKDELYPKIPQELHRPIFIKNGTFSDKFNFRNCAVLCSPLAIAAAFTDLSYDSLCFETQGNSEIVIRERIMADTSKVPTIYNGMPMRTEFRVFYDFDSKRFLYCHNYWDYDYCYPVISRNDASDAVVFEKYHAHYDEQYVMNKEKVSYEVAEALKNVQGLEGPWSVDVMMDEAGNFWLIDMATAYTSAYWDPEKAKN